MYVPKSSKSGPLTPSPASECVSHRDTYLEQQEAETIETEVRDIGRILPRRLYYSRKCTLAVQGGLLGGHKSAPVSHKHMLSPRAFSSRLINEDLPAGRQLVFTLNNRFFRYQACYSLLPARQGGQADRVVGLYKYKVVGVSPLRTKKRRSNIRFRVRGWGDPGRTIGQEA